MTSASVAHVTRKKYIVLSHRTYAMHNNIYNYNKFITENNSIV